MWHIMHRIGAVMHATWHIMHRIGAVMQATWHIMHRIGAVMHATWHIMHKIYAVMHATRHILCMVCRALGSWFFLIEKPKSLNRTNQMIIQLSIPLENIILMTQQIKHFSIGQANHQWNSTNLPSPLSQIMLMLILCIYIYMYWEETKAWSSSSNTQVFYGSCRKLEYTY